jgi:hypothetical protein
MGALQVDFRFNVMAFRAIDLFQGRVVHSIFHIVVAAGAFVVCMHRAEEKRSVHMRFGIGLPVAFEAVGIADLRLGAKSTDEKPERRQGEREF